MILCAPEITYTKPEFGINHPHALLFEVGEETLIASIEIFSQGFGDLIDAQQQTHIQQYLKTASNPMELDNRVKEMIGQMSDAGLSFSGTGCISWSSSSGKPLSDAIKEVTLDAVNGKISEAEYRMKMGKHVHDVNGKVEAMKGDVEAVKGEVDQIQKHVDAKFKEVNAKINFDYMGAVKNYLLDIGLIKKGDVVDAKIIQSGNKAEERKKSDFMTSQFSPAPKRTPAKQVDSPFEFSVPPAPIPVFNPPTAAPLPKPPTPAPFARHERTTPAPFAMHEPRTPAPFARHESTTPAPFAMHEPPTPMTPFFDMTPPTSLPSAQDQDMPKPPMFSRDDFAGLKHAFTPRKESEDSDSDPDCEYGDQGFSDEDEDYYEDYDEMCIREFEELLCDFDCSSEEPWPQAQKRLKEDPRFSLLNVNDRYGVWQRYVVEVASRHTWSGAEAKQTPIDIEEI